MFSHAILEFSSNTFPVFSPTPPLKASLIMHSFLSVLCFQRLPALDPTLPPQKMALNFTEQKFQNQFSIVAALLFSHCKNSTYIEILLHLCNCLPKIITLMSTIIQLIKCEHGTPELQSDTKYDCRHLVWASTVVHVWVTGQQRRKQLPVMIYRYFEYKSKVSNIICELCKNNLTLGNRSLYRLLSNCSSSSWMRGDLPGLKQDKTLQNKSISIHYLPPQRPGKWWKPTQSTVDTVGDKMSNDNLPKAPWPLSWLWWPSTSTVIFLVTISTKIDVTKLKKNDHHRMAKMSWNYWHNCTKYALITWNVLHNCIHHCKVTLSATVTK